MTGTVQGETLELDNARRFAAERAAAEAAATSLRTSEERLRLALESAAMGIWDWDPRTGQVTWSREVEALYGLEPGGFDGSYPTYLGLIHPDDRAAATARIAQAAESGSDFQTEHRVIWPDGTVHWVAGRGRAYRAADGTLERMAGTVMDVTASKVAELERAELLAREQAARADAEAAVQARDRFLSIASHELRTPVTTIKAAAQLVLRLEARARLDAEQLVKLVARIEQSSDYLGRLIADLLDVSRLQAGQLPLQLERLELAALLGDVTGRFSDQLEERQRIVLDLAGVAGTVEADPSRLEQVLWNLLDNAVKYSPDGGEIRLSLAREGSGALVQVRDSGIGLPSGTERSIFEPFGRAPNAAVRQLPGLGLGLHICRMLIERHGGLIWASSEGENRGTTIGFWLPVRAGEARSATELNSTAEA